MFCVKGVKGQGWGRDSGRGRDNGEERSSWATKFMLRMDAQEHLKLLFH